MLQHWVEVRRNHDLPRRPPFDPLCLPDQLPFIQLHERKPDGRYFCRVSGTAIVDVYGFESTNRHVDEVIDPDHLASRIAILDETLEHKRPVLYSGLLALQKRDWQGFQRLVLPFADAAGSGRFLLSILRFLDQRTADEPIYGLARADRHGLAMKQVATPAELEALRISRAAE